MFSLSNVKLGAILLKTYNLSRCMKEKIKEEARLYIAYGKMATYILNNSGTSITAKDLVNEIDIIPGLYN